MKSPSHHKYLRLIGDTLFISQKVFHIATISFMSLRQSSGYIVWKFLKDSILYSLILHLFFQFRNKLHFKISLTNQSKNLSICQIVKLCPPKKIPIQLKLTQINYVSRNQLHSTANLNFSLMCKKAKHCRGLGGRHFVDMIGDISWTKGVTFRGHFWRHLVDKNVHEMSSFWVTFRGHFFGDISWTLFR